MLAPGHSTRFWCHKSRLTWELGIKSRVPSNCGVWHLAPDLRLHRRVESRFFLCAKRAWPGLCWRKPRFHQGGDVMARPQTDLLLQHIRRLADCDAAAGSSDAELLRCF